MTLSISSMKDWEIDVKFQASGALLATATGVLLVPPQDALAFVTDEGAWSNDYIHTIAAHWSRSFVSMCGGLSDAEEPANAAAVVAIARGHTCS